MAWQEATLVSPDSPWAVSTARRPRGASDAGLVSELSILDILGSSPGSSCPSPPGPPATSQLGIQRDVIITEAGVTKMGEEVGF